MRAAIYGAGAMGTVLGAYISKNGGKIDLFTRDSERVKALNEKGTRVEGRANFTAPAKAYLPDEMEGRYDIIFLMTKQRDNAAICAFLKDHLAPDGVICTTQNGLPEASVAAVVGESRCIGCVVSWGATKLDGGASRLTSNPKKMTFDLGSVYGDNPKIAEARKILSLCGKVNVCGDFAGVRWTKLSVNCAFSSISAMTGKSYGEIAKGRRTKALALEILNECFKTALRCGVKPGKLQGHDVCGIYSYKGGLKRRLALALLPLAVRNHSDIVSGMYFDAAAGKKTDMDFVCGAVARSAREAGAEAPLNEAAARIVDEISRGEREMGEQNLGELEKWSARKK